MQFPRFVTDGSDPRLTLKVMFPVICNCPSIWIESLIAALAVNDKIDANRIDKALFI